VGTRILTLQRQARELGRLRAGLTEPTGNGRSRPARSKTWILTTHQRDYLDAAAEAWGGEVHQWTPQGGGAQAWRLITDAEAIDAILPPGDPLSQSYEMWSRGGCQRRCDGQIEQLSGNGCMCLAQFGDEFHLQPPDQACRPHTRLNVVLPDVPDLGVWRMETKGYYAANEIAASIDLIRNATGGDVMVPVRLRIEPRKRVAQGRTKQYPVIVVEIRGATAGQILGGVVPSLSIEGGEQRPAIAAAPAVEESAKLTESAVLKYASDGVASIEELQELWRRANADGVLTAAVKRVLTQRSNEFKAVQQPDAPARPVASAPNTAAVDVEVEPNPDEMFNRIISAAPDEWGTSGVSERIHAFCGSHADQANGFDLERFYVALKNGEVK
jgi:hypothetical protein